MDRRLTPANARVAHVSLQGTLNGPRFVEGGFARIATPLVDLNRDPGGPRDRQLLRGARVNVLERVGGVAFVQAERDGYVGYVAEDALRPDSETTHRVAAPATHLYPAPNLKTHEAALLSYGSELRIVTTEGAWSGTDDGHWLPTRHLVPVGEPATDLAAEAEKLLGTPYLWGGNSRSGIDCSGLVQLSAWACGKSCPGDSDLQLAGFGRRLAAEEATMRGDLLFWKGHVAIATDAETLVHANGHAMAVTHEGIADAVARILAAGEGPLLARKRP